MINIFILKKFEQTVVLNGQPVSDSCSSVLSSMIFWNPFSEFLLQEISKLFASVTASIFI